MKRWTILLVALLIVAVPFVLAACADDDTGDGVGAGEASPSPPMASPSPSPTESDIVGTAIDAGSFTTLVAALQASDLVETLQGEGPFTVFAPSDDAFMALPEGTLDELLADPQGDLRDILLYHVVEGEARSTDLSDGMTVTTVQGQELQISIRDGQVYVNDAMVTTADIETSNGVIHVTDSVLLPPAGE
jgi:transforming growth factor-beta-induced protein